MPLDLTALPGLYLAFFQDRERLPDAYSVSQCPVAACRRVDTFAIRLGWHLCLSKKTQRQ